MVQQTRNIEHRELNLDNVVRMAMIIHKQIESMGQSLVLLMIDRISRPACSDSGCLHGGRSRTMLAMALVIGPDAVMRHCCC